MQRLAQSRQTVARLLWARMTLLLRNQRVVAVPERWVVADVAGESEADNSAAIAVETPLTPASNIMASASLFIFIACRPECEVITLMPGCLVFIPGSACKRSPALQCQSRTTVMTKKRGAA